MAKGFYIDNKQMIPQVYNGLNKYVPLVCSAQHIIYPHNIKVCFYPDRDKTTMTGTVTASTTCPWSTNIPGVSISGDKTLSDSRVSYYCDNNNSNYIRFADNFNRNTARIDYCLKTDSTGTTAMEKAIYPAHYVDYSYFGSNSSKLTYEAGCMASVDKRNVTFTGDVSFLSQSKSTAYYTPGTYEQHFSPTATIEGEKIYNNVSTTLNGRFFIGFKGAITSGGKDIANEDHYLAVGDLNSMISNKTNKDNVGYSIKYLGTSANYEYVYFHYKTNLSSWSGGYPEYLSPPLVSYGFSGNINNPYYDSSKPSMWFNEIPHKNSSNQVTSLEITAYINIASVPATQPISWRMEDMWYGFGLLD